MTPLGSVVAGTLFVAVDLRLEQLDVVPDVIGWALLVWAGWCLRRSHHAFGWVALAGVAGLAVSAVDLVAGPSGTIEVVSLLAQTTAVFAVCTGIAARSADARRARQASRIRWYDLALAAAGLVVGAVVPSEAADDAVLLVLPLVVLALGVLVWYLVVVWAVRDELALGGPGPRPATGPGSNVSAPTS